MVKKGYDCHCHYGTDHCHATKHQCICNIDVDKCHATKHQCICNIDVDDCHATKHYCTCINSPNNCKLKQQGFHKHECICKKKNPKKCRAYYHPCTCKVNSKTCRAYKYDHYCSCDRDPKNCKTNRHQCICSSYPKKCRVIDGHYTSNINHLPVFIVHDCICSDPNFGPQYCRLVGNRHHKHDCICRDDPDSCLRRTTKVVTCKEIIKPISVEKSYEYDWKYKNNGKDYSFVTDIYNTSCNEYTTVKGNKFKQRVSKKLYFFSRKKCRNKK